MKQPTTDKELTYLVNCMWDSFEVGEFNYVDDLLKKLNIRQATNDMLLAHVTYSYAYRHQLPIWTTFRNNVYDEFNRRGVNADYLMQGMLEGLQNEQ